MTDLPASLVFYAMAESGAEADFWSGVKAAVWLYYENYTDAVDVVDGLLPALEKLVEVTGRYPADLYTVVREAEADFNSDPAASRDSEGRRRRVHTDLPEEEDDD